MITPHGPRLQLGGGAPRSEPPLARIPESHGVRIFGAGDGQGGMRVRLAFVDDAHSEDHQIEEHGTQFYVAQEVTEPLADVVIDTDDEEPSQLVLKRPEPIS